MPRKLFTEFEFVSENLIRDEYHRSIGSRRYIIPDDVFDFYREWAYYLTEKIAPLITVDGCGFQFPITLFIGTSLWESDSLTFGSSWRPNFVNLFLTDIISNACLIRGKYDKQEFLVVDHSFLLSDMIFYICHEISHLLAGRRVINNYVEIDEEEAKINAFVVWFLKKNNSYLNSLIQESVYFSSPLYSNLAFNISNLPATGCIRDGTLLYKVINWEGLKNNFIETPENWYKHFFSFSIRSNIVNLIQNKLDVVVSFILSGDISDTKYTIVIKKDGNYLQESIVEFAQVYSMLMGEGVMIYDYTVDANYPTDKASMVNINVFMKLKYRVGIEFDKENIEDDAEDF